MPAAGAVAGVELLNRALKRHRAETSTKTCETGKTGLVVRLAVVSDQARPLAAPIAEQRMWTYYVIERVKGRTPTGAELDRIAGTNNYGRKVLRKWRQAGHLPPAIGGPHGRRDRPAQLPRQRGLV